MRCANPRPTRPVSSLEPDWRTSSNASREPIPRVRSPVNVRPGISSRRPPTRPPRRRLWRGRLWRERLSFSA
jgi:hypothetical protein